MCHPDGQRNLIEEERTEIPVSVKTRIGFDKVVTVDWVQTLEKANPAWISIHGRTLKQMYTGKADWDELANAVEATDLPVLVNGDVLEHSDIDRILKKTKAAGVLIGRGSFGNPWIFREEKVLSLQDVIDAMLEHAELFVKYNPEPRAFVQMRKHFGWYCKVIQDIFNKQGEPTKGVLGFENVKALKVRLVRVEGLEEVRGVLGD
jgi:tRNA-dihydrouridine synthase